MWQSPEKGTSRVLTAPAAAWFSRPMPANNATTLRLRPTSPVEPLVASAALLVLVVLVLITSLTGAG